MIFPPWLPLERLKFVWQFYTTTATDFWGNKKIKFIKLPPEKKKNYKSELRDGFWKICVQTIARQAADEGVGENEATFGIFNRTFSLTHFDFGNRFLSQLIPNNKQRKKLFLRFSSVSEMKL
jgi:hypothetical protein